MSSMFHRVLVGFVALVVTVGGAVAVSQAATAAGSTPVVYVATGENFPDALGAASAAAVSGGPVLLVQKDRIPQVTRDELSRLDPDMIVVAGGTAVVSGATFEALKAYAPTVVRAAGADRYATAVEVSRSAFPVPGGGSTALEARVVALEAKVAQLEAMLAGVSRDGSTLVLEGMNLQVVNGEGTTATSNSLGNIIIGYNEDRDPAPAGYRTGSHYLVIGARHSYTAHGGIVAGEFNTASGVYASVTGGFGSAASGDHASAIGYLNVASGSFSFAAGGALNTASGDGSSVAGGVESTASGFRSSVTGGSLNTASGTASLVTGGYLNTASGSHSAVTGGSYNTASAYSASVTGGSENDARGNESSVSGGHSNTTTGRYGSVVGGDNVYITSADAMTAGEGFWNPVDP